MSSIFISHAVVDMELARLLVDFLKEAIGVPHSEIFCSSVPGHGVPMTQDFNVYMKDKIQKPQLVFLLMTASYMESEFCMMELGAAWAQSHVTLPIVVPPLSFGRVTKTLGLVQAWDINRTNGLIDLRRTVTETKIKLENRSEHDWEKKKAVWRASLKKILRKLPPASKVTAQEHSAALEKIAELEEEVNGMEKLIEHKNDIISKLTETKDAAAVKAILKKESDDDDPDEVLSRLIDDVKAALPMASRVVRMYIIMDYYEKAPKIDWFNYRQDFEDAIQRNLIENDEGHRVAWGRPKLSNLSKALRALDNFLAREGGRASLRLPSADVVTEADDLEFWEQHL